MDLSSKTALFSLCILSCVLGCNNPEEAGIQPLEPRTDSVADASASTEAATESPEEETPIGEPLTFELDPQALLNAALSSEQLEDGWVRLFDGQSLYGWFVVGKANWNVKDGVISVSRGEKSFLCTSFQLPNYEFKVDFRAEATTNSGVFMRTGPHPEDVATKCLELNIAPTDNPFPTGSFVQRQKLEPEDLNQKLGSPFDPTKWHTYNVKLVDGLAQVSLDDQVIMELEDFESNSTGHLSLQFNEGRIEFRNALLRPIRGKELRLDEDWEQDWEKSEKEEGVFAVETLADGLRLQGGLGQIQSKSDFGNFFLQASYTLAKPEVNSGIFFRCIRDDMLNGYECQVNHATEEDDPLRPADAGAGAIFRRQTARIVMGDGTQKSFISILANGQQMVTWVNGIQVAEFVDSREPDENPRKGMRVAPGPISIQGHDPTSDVTFHSLRVSDL